MSGNIVGLFGAMVQRVIACTGLWCWFFKLHSAVDGSCCIGQVFTPTCLHRASCGGFRCVSTAPPGEVSLYLFIYCLHFWWIGCDICFFWPFHILWRVWGLGVHLIFEQGRPTRARLLTSTCSASIRWSTTRFWTFYFFQCPDSCIASLIVDNDVPHVTFMWKKDDWNKRRVHPVSALQSRALRRSRMWFLNINIINIFTLLHIKYCDYACKSYLYHILYGCVIYSLYRHIYSKYKMFMQ